MGYVTAVIVKDMSRLGGDYLGVGYYTDTFFPEHNIRFIAVNDCVDSDDGENELAPFRSVMNEMYARDISRKVRSAHRIRGNSGEPLGQLPYGYRKDPLNKKHWIIDPEAAQVVRDIFRMCLEGKSNDTIARILQENGILNCTAYWHEKGIGRGGKKMQPNLYRWKNSTIRKILTQQEYCGDVLNFKTRSKSFKNDRSIDNPKEDWMVFEDRHEAIILRDTYQKVQKRMKSTHQRAPKKINGPKSIFCDILRCADCGSQALVWTDERKHITYITQDGKRCRDRSLHEEKYLKENMEYEFGIREIILGGTESESAAEYAESRRSEALRIVVVRSPKAVRIFTFRPSRDRTFPVNPQPLNMREIYLCNP